MFNFQFEGSQRLKWGGGGGAGGLSPPISDGG